MSSENKQCMSCAFFIYRLGSKSRGTCGHENMRGYLGLDGDGEISDEDGCNKHERKIRR